MQNKTQFKKGHMPWNLGKEHSNETKMKISKVSKRMYELHPEYKQNVVKNHEKNIVAWKKSIAEYYKTNYSWNKGLKGVQVAWNKGKKNIFSQEVLTRMRNSHLGKKHTKERIEKIRKAMLLKNRTLTHDQWQILRNARKYSKGIENPMYGKKYDQKHKDFVSQRTKLALKDPEKRKRMSDIKIEYFKANPTAKERMRQIRLNNKLPAKDTSIERILQKQLKDANIDFETYKPILGQPDVYIPSLNLCIFADGCYWHGCIDCGLHKGAYIIRYYRDFKIKRDLELEGYNVIRFREHEINSQDFDLPAFLGKYY